jgi:HB1, ASXL, restriction endonuclease HTH domain
MAKKNAAEKSAEAKTPKAKKEAKPKKMSALNAAAKVLAQKGEPMTCQEMIEAMTSKGLWSSPKGKTPAATLYAAILRELKTKGGESRFKKTERGKFAATGKE